LQKSTKHLSLLLAFGKIKFQNPFCYKQTVGGNYKADNNDTINNK